MGGFFGGGATPMVGATASVAGSGGSVPAPAAGDQNRCLTGAATFLPNLILPAGDFTSTAFIGPSFVSDPTPNTYTPTSGNLLFWSFFLPKAVSISGIQVRNSTTGTAIVRLGLYSMDMTTGKPSSLLADAGTVDCSATSSEKVASISGNYAASSGWIYAAFAYSTTGSLTAVQFFGINGGRATNLFNGLVFGKSRINDTTSSDYADTTYSGGSLPSSPSLTKSNSGYAKAILNLVVA